MLALLVVGAVVAAASPVPFRLVAVSLVELAAVGCAWAWLLPQQGLPGRGYGMNTLALTLEAACDLTMGVGRLRGAPIPELVPTAMLSAAYVVAAVGCWQMLRFCARTKTRDGSSELVVLCSGLLAPVLLFVLVPQLEAAPSAPMRVVLVCYAVANVVAVLTVARLWINGVTRSPALVFLMLCSSVSLAGGVWALASGAVAPWAPTPVCRVLWLAMMLTWTAAMAQPSLRALNLTAPSRPGADLRNRVLVLGIGLVLPTASLGIALLRGDGAPTLWVIAGFGLMATALAGRRAMSLLARVEAQSAELAVIAGTDELTGLPNSTGWRELLARTVADARRTGQGFCVVAVELDEFASFNSRQGVASGDRFLRHLAADCCEALHDGEHLARTGGVQFALVLPQHDPIAAAARVEELRALVPLPQTISVGLAAWTPGTGIERLVAAAQGALYRARCAGGDRLVVAGPTDGVVPGPLRDLQVAVQPIVRVRDGVVVAYECLSRFPHTTAVETVFADAHAGGFGDLLEVAAINRVLAEPGRPDGVEVFVNASERAMRSEAFWAGLPHDLRGVVVELVETRDGLSDDGLVAMLGRFRERGARIALDDVGSSATDFARIAALRPDIAKIDRSLVSGCDTDPAQGEVLAMLVGFARRHGVQVVIEGVETPGELEVARTVGAALAQGYLLGRPEPAWPGAGSTVSIAEDGASR
ncbi:bifunctional diguanylate cyclase/phosphodiesterase [Nocardioides mangrovicus]|uniref:Bifunctional diguanylate cyclase/phosphodiesterase n=1 Tax=Nocardioides mangrovicus TaxID=2478913 RepID=A0A3L8NZA0_9ACTN|nr:bifunctional diguanylate cyclase/phosphodiesterase [Nocardioides mangrovicus]RLV48546.1 bifunctional diguanylate cyclase/phosphodiesterase [Nocardioides mangrovicus]